MDINKKNIAKLNEILRGEYSALEAYKQVLEKIEANGFVDDLRRIQSEHQEAAITLKNLITELDGKADDNSGAWGIFAKTITGAASLFGDNASIKILKEGEEHGLKQYEEYCATIESDAIPSLKNLIITRYIPQQKDHIQTLNQMMIRVAS